MSVLRNVSIVGIRWRLVNAKDEVLGRLASRIAVILMGKDKPTYTPHWDEGDVVVVKNARHVVLTGKKMKDKIYYWHTGYPGGLKQRTAAEQMQRDPTEILRKAVQRMLPQNRLRDDRMRKLRIFADEGHEFTSQTLEPFVMPPRNTRLRPSERRRLERERLWGKPKGLPELLRPVGFE